MRCFLRPEHRHPGYTWWPARGTENFRDSLASPFPATQSPPAHESLPGMRARKPRTFFAKVKLRYVQHWSIRGDVVLQCGNAEADGRDGLTADAKLTGMEDGLLRTFHASLAEPDLARRREVALAARCLDRSSLGYKGVDALGEAESLLEADVSLLRAQLGASAIWDPDLSARLRRWAVGGARAIGAGFSQVRLPPLGGVLEASGAVEGDGLQILTNEAWSRGTSVAHVWVYRFRRPTAAAAHLGYHPALAAESCGLRAALLFRDPATGAHPDANDVVEVQVLLATTCRAVSPPSGLPLPAAAAPTSLEMRLRQRALEVMSAEASGYSALADILRRDLADLATSSGVEVPGDSSLPHFAVRLHDLANLEEEEGIFPRSAPRSQQLRASEHRRPPVDISKRPATSDEALLEADLAAALAAAQRLLKQDVSEVVKSMESPRVGPAEPPMQPDQLAMQQGLLQLARGLDAKALVHSGDKVPVNLAVNPDYTVNVKVAGESRAFQLTSIDEVACGDAAVSVLRGCLSRPPPSRVCALRLHDGKCLALLLPLEVSPEVFVRCLLELREGAGAANRGKMVTQRSSEGASSVSEVLNTPREDAMQVMDRLDAGRHSPAIGESQPRGSVDTLAGSSFLEEPLADTQELGFPHSSLRASPAAVCKSAVAQCQLASPQAGSLSPPPTVHLAQTMAAARPLAPLPAPVLALPYGAGHPAAALQVQTLPTSTVVTQSMPLQMPQRASNTWTRTIVFPPRRMSAPDAPLIRTMPGAVLPMSTLQGAA
eukprot:s2456_g2.t2